MLGWLIPKAASAKVDTIWRSFAPDDELVAPALMLAESTSVLNGHAHFGRISPDYARQQVERMLRIGIRTVNDVPLYLRAFDIARSLGWAKAYDALYLAAAEGEGAHLLTLDRGLHEAAVRLGIPATLIAE